MLIVDDLHNQVPPVYVESLKEDVQLLHTQGAHSRLRNLLERLLPGSANLSNHPQRQHLRKYKMKEGDKKVRN